MKLLRNPLIVGILLVLAGFLVLRSFRGTLWHRWFPPKRPAPTAAAALPAPPTPPVTPPSPPPRTVPDQGIDFSQVGWIKSPRRDPFRATGRILLVETPTGPSGKAQELLNLQAIWRQTASRMAVINGRIITEGDTIAGFKVEKIEEDGISLISASGPERLDFKFTSPAPSRTDEGKTNAANPVPRPEPPR